MSISRRSKLRPEVFLRFLERLLDMLYYSDDLVITLSKEELNDPYMGLYLEEIEPYISREEETIRFMESNRTEAYEYVEDSIDRIQSLMNVKRGIYIIDERVQSRSSKN